MIGYHKYPNNELNSQPLLMYGSFFHLFRKKSTYFSNIEVPSFDEYINLYVRVLALVWYTNLPPCFIICKPIAGALNSSLIANIGVNFGFALCIKISAKSLEKSSF